MNIPKELQKLTFPPARKLPRIDDHQSNNIRNIARLMIDRSLRLWRGGNCQLLKFFGYRRYTFLIPLLCIICTLTTGSLSAKIRLLTFHFNKPELILLQHRAFQKFMEDDYELIVFNDAKTVELEAAIQAECDRCGIKCVRYEQEGHTLNALTDQMLKWQQDPSVVKLPYFFAFSREEIAQQASVRHCHVIQYALEEFGYGHDDIVAIVDGDLFPVRPIALRQMMQNTPIVASMKPEVDIPYFWVTFVAIDMPKLPDKRELSLSMGCINGVMYDSGAYSYLYMKSHPEVSYKGFSVVNSAQVYSLDPAILKARYGFSEEECELMRTVTQNGVDIDFQIEGRFLHMRGSHNEWYMQRKQAAVTDFFEQLLNKKR